MTDNSPPVRQAPSARTFPTITFMLLNLICFGAAVSLFTLNPIQEALRVSWHLDDNQIALLQGPTQLAVLFACLPLGVAIDRLRRRNILITLAALNLAAAILTATAPSLPFLLIGRCLAAVAANCAIITAYALLGDLFEARHRGRAKAALGITQYAAKSLAFALGGWALESHAGSVDGWRSATLWLSALPALAFAASLLLREPPRGAHDPTSLQGRTGLGGLIPWLPLMAPIMAAMALVDLALVGGLTWTAPALMRVHGLGPGAAGAIMATTFLVSGLAGPLLGGLVADFCHRSGGPRRTVGALAALALFAAAAAAYPLAPSVAAASIGFALFVVAASATLAIGITVFTIVIPADLRGQCLSFWLAINIIFGAALGPVAVSLLSAWLGGPAMLHQAVALAGVTGCLTGAALFMHARRRFSHGPAQ